MTDYMLKRLFDVQDADQTDTDQIGLCWTPQAGNCSGVTNWIELGQKEIDLIKRLNPGDSIASAEEKIHWAVWERTGGIYFAEDRERAPWRWPSIVMGSKSSLPGEFNRIETLEIHKGYHRIATIPVLGSYAHISLATHPHLIHRVYVTNARGVTYDTPKGPFYMPLFSPEGRRHAKGNLSGMWLRGKYVGGEVAGEDVPPVDPPVDPPPPPAENYEVIVIAAKTTLRQQPKATSSKIDPVGRRGERFTVVDVVNDWGLTGGRGWIWLADTRRA